MFGKRYFNGILATGFNALGVVSLPSTVPDSARRVLKLTAKVRGVSGAKQRLINQHELAILPVRSTLTPGGTSVVFHGGRLTPRLRSDKRSPYQLRQPRNLLELSEFQTTVPWLSPMKANAKSAIDAIISAPATSVVAGTMNPSGSNALNDVPFSADVIYATLGNATIFTIDPPSRFFRSRRFVS